MSKQSSVVGTAYAMACVLVFFPLADLGTNLWPWKVGAPTWRYGSYGLLSGYVLTALLGLALALATAILARHNRMARGLAVLSGLLGVVFLASTAVYGLDAIQVHAGAPAGARTQFAIGTAKALFKNVFSMMVLFWFARAGWRASGVAAARDADGNRTDVLVSSGSG